ncbi:putative S-layer protein [Cylindrospermum stagnale PCC 7417]|uniref:Putative S-layer protein n=1 Tax=Cylindrospermum stagnale PCC 7417 TaxID=56107 RepID=K9WZ45_9NOST|nr:S-layer homology domain-containing protein [Cylindrospermum stagnale]AFZ25630.1 putative S-layer protein [Cylindrospermum stagnale PCC 7417]
MTNLPPSDRDGLRPAKGDRLRPAKGDRQSSPTTALGFDEFIAILVVFATIGGILFWSLGRRDSSWHFPGVLTPNPTSSPGILSNQALPSPLPQINKSVGSHSNSLSSPPPAAVVEPNTMPTDNGTPAPILPPIKVVPIELPTPGTSPTLSLVTPAEKKSIIPPPIAFNDVPNNFWGRRFIDVLSSRGLIKGFPDYTFRPNQPVTRAEFAAILQQAFDSGLDKSTIAFKDVPTKFWATPAIDQAISTGFLKGYPQNTFKPEQKISRGQVLVALVSGLKLKVPAASKQNLLIYQDAKDIPQYATGKITAATANGLVVNYPNPEMLAPNKPATRAEVVAMIHQALVRMGRLEEIKSQNIVPSPSLSLNTKQLPKR